MWLVESLIVNVTPVSRLERERPVGDQLQAILCSSDDGEHPHSLPLYCDLGRRPHSAKENIAQDKI
jgi:hypothetical protein